MTVRRRIPPQTQTLPIPPDTYSPEFMRRLVSTIQRVAGNQEQAATLRGGWLNLSDLEPSVYKLTDGDVWQDASYLRIVRAGDFGPFGESLTASVGNVSVTVV